MQNCQLQGLGPVGQPLHHRDPGWVNHLRERIGVVENLMETDMKTHVTTLLKNIECDSSEKFDILV